MEHRPNGRNNNCACARSRRIWRQTPSGSRAHLGTVKRVRDAAYVGHVSCRRWQMPGSAAALRLESISATLTRTPRFLVSPTCPPVETRGIWKHSNNPDKVHPLSQCIASFSFEFGARRRRYRVSICLFLYFYFFHGTRSCVCERWCDFIDKNLKLNFSEAGVSGSAWLSELKIFDVSLSFIIHIAKDIIKFSISFQMWKEKNFDSN